MVFKCLSKKRINNIAKLQNGLIILIIVLIVACARPASPVGGPKDETPPIPLKSKPINYSTNFKGNKIIILFDEFIVLKNVTQEILMSPPLEELPEIKQRGKNLMIKLLSECKDSTTYGINFYESITDLNEGNLLKNFQFEFSTGNNFDSLYLGGNVKDAFNFTTQKGIFVMLYEAFNDSTPRKTKPAYISKTDEEGNFFITNIKNIPYYIFALQDKNNNMMFDLPTEAIAFSQKTFSPSFTEIEVVDTFAIIDTISPDLQDTIFVDSLYRHNEFVTTIGNIQLLLFNENSELQYFKESYRKERQQVIFAFNRELNDTFWITPLIEKYNKKQWFIPENQAKKDSLVFWIKDSSVFNIDSLKFQVNYTMLDSNQNKYIETDTLMVLYTEPEVKKDKKDKDKKGKMFDFNLFNKDEEEELEIDTVVPSLLTFTNNVKTPFELNKHITITARFPIQTYNTDKITLVKIEDDSIETPIKFNFSADSLLLRNFNIDFEKDEEEHFKLLIPAGCFTDIYGNINDTLSFDFTTRELAYYGNILMHIINLKQNSMIQLLNEKELLIEERNIYSDTSITFEYLDPKKYILKLYYDINRNKKWDTGNYLELLQPEEVFYFPLELDIKSNFDYEHDWDLYPVPPSTIQDSIPADSLQILPEQLHKLDSLPIKD